MSIYTKIGPFKNVPEHMRALAAERAEASAQSALEAAKREAEEARDTASDHDAVFSSERHLTDYDSHNISDTAQELKSARIGIAAATAFLSVLWTLLMIPAYEAWSNLGSDGLGQIYFLATIALAMSLITHLIVTWPALRAISEIRKQGFIKDRLTDRLVVRAGTCWLLGDKALHIVETPWDKKHHTKSVFYDAIGCAKVRVESGLETVALFSRDGTSIASITCPSAPTSSALQGLTAKSFAELLTKMASERRALQISAPVEKST